MERVSARSNGARRDRSYGRGQRGVAEVEGRDGQGDVTPEDDDRQRNWSDRRGSKGISQNCARRGAGVFGLTGEHVPHGEGDDHRRHEELVGGRVENAPEDSAHPEPASEPAVRLMPSSPSISGTAGRAGEEKCRLNEVRYAGDKEQGGRGCEVTLEDVVPDRGAGNDPRNRKSVRDGVDVLVPLLRTAEAGCRHRFCSCFCCSRSSGRRSGGGRRSR